MQLRYRLALPLAAICCLAFAVAPALASKPAPTAISQSPTVGPINSVLAACPMGILPPPALIFGYILPPGDAYYTLLDPADCPACPGNSYRALTAHVLLYYTEPCTIPATVSIVPAFDDDGDGCFTPNPFAPPLCDAATYQLSDAGQIGVCVDYQLPITQPCCFTGKVFVNITFDQGTCNPGRPAFCGPGSCVNCRQYNYYPGATFPGDDLCAVLGPQGVYGIDMWVDTECCQATPTLPGSWGMLKTLYR